MAMVVNMGVDTLKESWNKNERISAALAMREERLFALLKAGGGKLSDFMQADFGTKNPIGLDIDHWAGDPEITLQDARDSLYYKDDKAFHWKFLGSVTWATPDKVNLHPIFNQLKKLPSFPLKKHAMDMISHEALHSRQGFEKQAGFDCIPDMSCLAGIEPKNTAQKKKVSRLETGVSLKSFGKYSIKGYLSSSVEVQARMHEIIPQAYVEWGRIPATQTEFFAAMHHTGMKVSPSIIEDLKNTEAGRAALKDFSLGQLA